MHGPWVTTDLVLVGGGHAHVHVLRSFGMRPEPGLRLTLIARDVETPYSGMLPGLIAGHYGHDDCHIDLRRLARFANARLVHDEAVGLDRAARRVLCRGRPPIRYDLISIDIGSTPSMTVPGAASFATPVKPIDGFERRWSRIVERVRAAEHPLRIVTIGGGAGGVEITLAMQHRLRKLLGSLGRDRAVPTFALVTRGELLPHHNGGVRRAFLRTLEERGIALHRNAGVVAVEADHLVCAGGARVGFDEALWVTAAGAAPWLKETGLALDPAGFIAVDATLRSVSDPLIFAAGDVAAVLPHPREKAGVFAVRQGPPLADNLRRAAARIPPRPFRPQRLFLSLISTGDRYAVASRGTLFAEGAVVWRLKDWIDRRWMRQYRELPPMPARAGAAPSEAEAEMRCGGCGAKVPADVLQRVMRRLAPRPADGVPVGLDAPDDAAVVRPPHDRLLLQTVDFFRSFVDDPYLFGRIAANHALGDIYAMGGAPATALAIACVPPSRDEIVEEDLYQMLCGGLETIEAAGACLVGGHSAEGSELSLGFSVTGSVPEGHVLRKGGLSPGDRLILTKPIGTGALLAAEMRGKAKARWIEAAVEAMLLPAAGAAACLLAHGAVACTDVTGFGLLGHLIEMLRASRTDAVLRPEEIPVLDGAAEMLAAGIASTLHPSNEALGRHFAGAAAWPLLFDPQTAGGLLAGVPADRADGCVAVLRQCGYSHAAIIGTVEARAGADARVRVEAVRRAPG